MKQFGAPERVPVGSITNTANNHMNTPTERTVEEIVEDKISYFENKAWIEVKDVKEIIKTERQKREEVVEAERERTRLAESYIIGKHIDEYYTKAEALTKPNNPDRPLNQERD